MKCITVQKKEVLDILLKDGICCNDTLDHVPQMRKKAYQGMMQAYDYQHVPFFLGAVDIKCEMYGADFSEDSVAVELDIPDDEPSLHVQDYYCWGDFLYYSQYEDEFRQNFSDLNSLAEFGQKFVFNETVKGMNRSGQRDAYQVTVDILRKEWITGIADDLTVLEVFHDGQGGNNVLHPLDWYRK